MPPTALDLADISDLPTIPKSGDKAVRETSTNGTTTAPLAHGTINGTTNGTLKPGDSNPLAAGALNGTILTNGTTNGSTIPSRPMRKPAPKLSTSSARTKTSKKTFHTTTNKYERKFGYHRAVRKGPFIFVSGTTAVDPDTNELMFPGMAYQQAKTAMEEAVRAVKALGGKGAADVVRVKMFVGSPENADKVGKAFHDIFSGKGHEVGAAATMIMVGKDGFVDPEMLVEVEVDAVASEY